jgi:hypothetical protein
MKKRKLVMVTACAVCVSFAAGFNMQAKADYFSVLRTIGGTASAINSVNSASRGTMSTVEYAQRFTDRQQDRKDRKRAEKEYNENAEQEYYRTLQETESLRQQQYYNNSHL